MKNLLLLTLLFGTGTFLHAGNLVAECDADFTYTIDGMTVSFTDLSTADEPILEWTWDFGDGTTSNEENPVHTYAEPGEYDVCLIIHADGACFADVCESNIPVGEMEITCDAEFVWEGPELTVSFFDESEVEGDIVSYHWDFDDGTTSDDANPVHTFPAAGIYEVCLTIVTEEGGATCTSTTCHTVIVGGIEPDCYVAFDYEVDGGAVYFDIMTEPGPGDVESYYWEFGDGSFSDDAEPVHEYEPGLYIVCVTVVFADGCIAEYCDDLLIAGGDCIVTAEIIGEEGLSEHFWASVEPEFEEITYTWTFGDGESFTEITDGGPSDPWHEYAEPGIYHVCVVIETGGGCIDEYCFDVVVGGEMSCHANFEWETDGLTVHFINNSEGDGDVSYSWSFGDGGTSTAENPFHTYSEPGVYMVCLEVSYEEAGMICTDLICYEVHVEGGGADCESDFEFDVDGFTVHFYETADGEVTDYIWDFGDGDMSDDSNPTHTYDEPGTYVVCLTIITADGCEDEFCWEVHITEDGGDCESDFEFDVDGLVVHFFETADGGGADITSYHWTFGDGSVSDDANPTHEYEEPGVYEVCLTITTADGCVDTYCHEVHVEGAGGDCEAYFEVTSIELTPDGWLVNFNNESFAVGDIETVTWYFGDGESAETFDAEHIYTEPGVYLVCVVITTADGCVDEYCNEIVIEGEGECSSYFTWETEGMTGYFHEDADGGGSEIISYLWYFGDGTFSLETDPDHEYAVAGEYEVCLVIVTADSCVAVYCEIIEVGEAGDDCIADFEIESIEETDSGWMVNFTNTSTGSDNYHWTFGDGGASEMENPEHLYTEPGIYLVCLTIGVAGTDCFDEYCQEIFVGGDDDCANPEIIDSLYACPEIYEPVCGCDGVTYDNSCFAEYYGGILFWTEGACETGILEENIFSSINIYPNPAQNSSVISYTLNANSEIRIDVIDVTGRNMMEPVIRNAGIGNYEFVINTSEFASGIYFVRISGSGVEQTSKLMITR